MEKANRIARLQDYMKDRDIQALLIEDAKNRQYLTYADIWEGSMVVTCEKAFLCVDFRYYEMAKRYCRDCEIVLCKDIDECLKRLFEDEKIKRLGIERGKLVLNRFIQIRQILGRGTIEENICADQIVKEFRKVKDEYELTCIRKAQELTDAAYAHILTKVHAGMMESEIRIALGSFLIRHGSEDFNIGYISSSGSKTSMPHGGIGDKMIEDGDLLMIDFGARIGGYTSDCTRTFGIGHVTEEQKEVYALVRDAQTRAIEGIRPGIEGRAVDQIARTFIYEHGYQGCFEHGLGHSVGLEGHENPRFNQICEEKMRPGIVMTVEPGIYLENRFGIRIENMGVVTETGFEDFTHCTRDLVIV